MRVARLSVVLAVLGLVGASLASGCLDPTQMTLEISLAKRAQCTEIHGTAITVGVDPMGTEDRVRLEYVSATTNSCDVGSRAIGTLVLTPSGDSASVVVVAAYDQLAPSSCKPPAYKGCIVARRHFSFAKHQRLTLPITIDPNCKDVPCDAFSTCRNGLCFSSNAPPCSGDACLEPGATPDGGTSEAGVVIPDAGLVDAAAPDGSRADGGGEAGTDAGGDAGDDGGSSDPTYCTQPPQDSLVCGLQSCAGGSNFCCGTSLTNATCRTTACVMPARRYCCQAADCGGSPCPRAMMAFLPLPLPAAQMPNPNGGPGLCP